MQVDVAKTFFAKSAEVELPFEQLMVQTFSANTHSALISFKNASNLESATGDRESDANRVQR
jgi:hypothetical protein